MTYVALLRGINVGGNNKIDMRQLKASFERIKMQSVVTYINTGNIIFVDEKRSKAEIVEVIEKMIADDFGLQIKVVLRDINDFEILMKQLPDEWKNDKEMKSDVMFLWEEVDDKSVLEKVIVKEGIDTVTYIPGTLLWMVDRKNQTKSGMQKLVGTKVYKLMTIRNVNTTRKIYDLMKNTP
jgi:uncharacterized protein (DUF1697 family)